MIVILNHIKRPDTKCSPGPAAMALLGRLPQRALTAHRLRRLLLQLALAPLDHLGVLREQLQAVLSRLPLHLLHLVDALLLLAQLLPDALLLPQNRRHLLVLAPVLRLPLHLLQPRQLGRRPVHQRLLAQLEQVRLMLGAHLLLLHVLLHDLARELLERVVLEAEAHTRLARLQLRERGLTHVVHVEQGVVAARLQPTLLQVGLGGQQRAEGLLQLVLLVARAALLLTAQLRDGVDEGHVLLVAVSALVARFECHASARYCRHESKGAGG